MELKKLIMGRRTIQKFAAEKVSEQAIREALALCLWAPNHRMTFPWFFALVEGEARVRLADLAVQLKGKEGVRSTVMNPSHLLVVGIKREDDPQRDRENFATLACSVQILMTCLWEKGIGSKWSTSGFAMHQKTYEVLGVSPDEIRIEGCVLIGKPEVVPPPGPRPELSAILRIVS